MSSGGFGGVIPHIFPSLGPAILISMAYIDLGKWVAAVEGGARFGFDLVLPVLIFNCIAILCHYLSTCIGMVTGKNLAEICSEEYSRLACILLGILAELSMIVSDLTMVLGVAHGLTLLFAMDLFSCILFAILAAFLLPLLLKLLDNGKAEAFYVSIACFALLFYVLGVLISQPEVPVVTNEFFPKLTGENAYSVMALLGANIMSHNFYIHSSIVQQQGRLSNIALGALFHDHFFAILFIFTGIFLVNYVLITSAAAVFGNTDVVALNFQDVSLVMEQIFKNPIAPVAFLLVLFFSCQTTALTRTIGGQVISQHLFGTKLSVWVHHFLSKSFTTFLAFYCARIGGAEGIYQSLIVCQIILGMLLPSAAIPLFRVASSRCIMGIFKTSWYTEILALLAFLGMLAANVIFIIEILFGNSSWTVSLKESNGTLYTFLLLGFTPTCFTMYLAVTPLKSASNKPESHISTRNFQKDLLDFSHGTEESNIEMIKYDEDRESVAEATFERCLESQSDRSTTEYNPDVSQAALDSDHDSQQSTYGSNIAVDVTSPAKHSEGSTSVAEERPPELSYNDSTGCLHGKDRFQQNEFGEHVEVDVTPETDLLTVKKNEEADAVEPENFAKGLFAPLISEGPRPVNITKSASKDVGNDSGSLSKLSGLGRAGRRQLAAILDEFWGNLFDFHGKLTQDASSKRLDILLGLDFKVASSSGKTDSTAAESSKVLFSDTDKGQYFLQNSREYSSPRQINIQGTDLPFGIQMGTSSWSHSMQQADAHVLRSGRNMFDPSERTYSSLHMPQCSDDRDYQPATIHGYQMPSYLRGISTGRTPYSSRSTNLPPTNKVSASYISTLRDQVMYSHGQNILGPVGTSSLQNPSLSRMNTLQVERPYYEQPLMGTSEHAVSPAYTKKYHSSPDISAIVALTRNLYLNEGKQSTSIGPQTSFGRMASEQSRYLNPLSRTGAPLAFDELSPSKVHRDIFPLQPSLNSETKSLFSRQPFEELFGMVDGDHGSDRGAAGRSSITGQETFPYAESEAKLLHSLRFCIMKLLKLDGSDWLFSQNGGADEELIDQVSIAEKCLPIDTSEMSQSYADEFQYLSSDRKFNAVKRSEEGDLACPSSLPNCGDGCVWHAALVVSFGVWCIQRVLELLVVESRPELWGKYTYVLNRLQGIIEPAFSKPRLALKPCTCLGVSVKCLTNFSSSSASEIPGVSERNSEKSLTTASTVLELIRDVEAAVSNRKGRTGTAAGDVAFPKGKENLASVLKRYKRRLSYKPLGSNEGTSMRKIPSSSSGL